MIEFKEGFDFCHWNDIHMDSETMIKMFGTDTDFIEVYEGIVFTDDILFCSDVKILFDFIMSALLDSVDKDEMISKTRLPFLNIKKILPYDDINKIKINSLNSFLNELNNYYKK